MTDRELLEQFARHRSEDTFNKIVRRHVNLVHSAALRQLGSADTARVITQTVFILLAKQADRLKPDVILTGWLYRTTRNLCLEHIRKDQRRRDREHEAADHLMNDSNDQWEHVAPELEPAMDELAEPDRQAVLLRFFNNRSLRDVGTELGIGEDAAQKRVSRALDRLRAVFSKQGVTLTATALATTISGCAVQATPAAILATISSAAIGAGLTTAVTATAFEATSTMTTLFNLKTATAIVAAAALTGTSTYLVKDAETQQLRAEQSVLAAHHARLAENQQQALVTIQLRDQQIQQLKKDVADIHRLRGEVDRLNRDLVAMSELERNVTELKLQLKTALSSTGIVPEAQSKPANEYDEEFLERYGLWNEEQVKAAKVSRLNDYRLFGFGLIMHADANQGWFPQMMKEAQLYLNTELGVKTPELLFSGKISEIKDPSRTIVARQARVSRSPGSGEVWRVYTFGDGHSEIHSAATQEKLFEWENSRMIPLERQSRTPMNVSLQTQY